MGGLDEPKDIGPPAAERRAEEGGKNYKSFMESTFFHESSRAIETGVPCETIRDGE